MQVWGHISPAVRQHHLLGRQVLLRVAGGLGEAGGIMSILRPHLLCLQRTPSLPWLACPRKLSAVCP